MNYANMVLVDSVTTLPSIGLPYDGQLPGGRVTLKEMTAHELKILAGAKGSGYDTINGILRRLIVDCPISLSEMLTSDRLYILYAIRVLAYGPTYGYDYKCPDCGFQSRDEVNIMELDIKFLDEADSFDEPFVETIDGIEFEFILPRGRMEQAAEKYTSRAYRRGTDGDPYQLYMVSACVKRMGDKEFKNANQAIIDIQKLPARRFWELRDAIDDHDCGMPDTVEAECARCGYITDITLPMSAEFFRPRSRRGRQR